MKYELVANVKRQNPICSRQTLIKDQKIALTQYERRYAALQKLQKSCRREMHRADTALDQTLEGMARLASQIEQAWRGTR